MEKIKRRARRGLSLLTSKKMRLSPASDEEKIEEKAELEEENEYAEGTANKSSDDQVKEKRAKYEFLRKVTKRGRPKHSGAGSLKFPSPRKMKRRK